MGRPRSHHRRRTLHLLPLLVSTPYIACLCIASTNTSSAASLLADEESWATNHIVEQPGQQAVRHQVTVPRHTTSNPTTAAISNPISLLHQLMALATIIMVGVMWSYSNHSRRMAGTIAIRLSRHLQVHHLRRTMVLSDKRERL